MYQAPPPVLKPWSKGRAIGLGFSIYAIGAVLIRFAIKLLLNDSILLGVSIFGLLVLMNLSLLWVVRSYKRSQQN